MKKYKDKDAERKRVARITKNKLTYDSLSKVERKKWDDKVTRNLIRKAKKKDKDKRLDGIVSSDKSAGLDKIVSSDKSAGLDKIVRPNKRVKSYTNTK